jgi:hypothetical protein
VLRSQLATLKRFIEGFDFLRMAPRDAVIVAGVPEGATARVLADPSQQYAIYLKGGSRAALTLDLPAGRYRAEWLNPRTGKTDKTEDVNHAGGHVVVASPEYTEDIALGIRAR